MTDVHFCWTRFFRICQSKVVALQNVWILNEVGWFYKRLLDVLVAHFSKLNSSLNKLSTSCGSGLCVDLLMCKSDATHSAHYKNTPDILNCVSMATNISVAILCRCCWLSPNSCWDEFQACRELSNDKIKNEWLNGFIDLSGFQWWAEVQ